MKRFVLLAVLQQHGGVIHAALEQLGVEWQGRPKGFGSELMSVFAREGGILLAESAASTSRSGVNGKKFYLRSLEQEGGKQGTDEQQGSDVHGGQVERFSFYHCHTPP